MSKKTITVLPQTDATTLYIQLSGTITKDDYLESFDTPVRAIPLRRPRA